MMTNLTITLTLGRQVERRVVRRHGHKRYERVEGGAVFASLFPSLVGTSLEIGSRSQLELAGKPELMGAVLWLSENGYFTRGGLQS
jgi:hypothetical protein